MTDDENYRNTADFFEARYEHKDYGKEAAKFSNFVSAVHPGARSLLDVACGAGNHLQHLKNSYRVEGIDLNARLLEIAATRLDGAPLHIGDMCNFEVGRKFDLVTCLFGSIAMSRDVENMRNATRTMAKHLEHDGLLFIEPYLTPGVYREGEVVHNFREHGDRKLSWMYVMHRRDNVATWEIHWIVGQRDGQVLHFVENEEYALFETQECVDAMADAGLHAICHPYGLHGYGAIIGRRKPWTDLEIGRMNDAFAR